MDTTEDLAGAILLAQKIREDSYDHKAASEAMNSGRCPNFEQFYRMSFYKAADKAAEQFGFDLGMTKPIELLITLAWNDSQEWAIQILKKEID